MMDSDTKYLKEKAEKIKTIYDDAVVKVRDLEKKQKKIVEDFVKELEQKKIEEIRKLIINS